MLALIAAALAAITLAVDARDVRSQVWHATESLPLDGRAGVVTVVYPKWIPGAHSASGPIAGLGSLRASAGGTQLTWRRQLDDLYAFDIDVPAGARHLALAYDFFEGGAPSNASQRLAVLDWNDVVLYPKGAAARTTRVQPSVLLPEGWRSATALDPNAGLGTASARRFPETTLETLVDSPLYMGENARAWPLYHEAGGAAAEFDAFAETGAALAAPPAFAHDAAALVREALAAFGARHWTHYRFLLELSDVVQGRGLEHHASSENGTGERGLVDPERLGNDVGELVAHEFTHSWNGKYRRPAGLATPDYQTPMQDELLWVYEGLTQYYGEVLAARSGFVSADVFRARLADSYAALDAETGRRTTPLVETTKLETIGRGLLSPAGRYARRSLDYYSEGALMWLEADTLIRARSGGRKSFDDVAHLFLGPPDSAPKVVPYTRADLIGALNRVLPYDWAGFLTARVDRVALHPPSGGFTNGGWRLVYGADRTPAALRAERLTHALDARYSLGAQIDSDGTIPFVIDASPFARGGFGPGMKILAVNDHAYTTERMRDALAEAHRTHAPLRFVTDDLGTIRDLTVHYDGGERYPRLVRVPGSADRIDAIAAARTHQSGKAVL